MRPGYLLALPETDYRQALALQHRAVAARREGRLARDLVVMLEHPPVFTLGRRGGRENLLVPEEVLKEKSIALVPIERGGDITYHGPEQLVVYPIIDLNAAQLAVVAFVGALEQAMVATAAHWDLKARGDAVHRGAWVENRKLGSVGITVRRGISFHGLALNVATDLTPFTWINPCGIQACTMTTLSLETGAVVSMQAVRNEMARHLSDLLGLEFETISLASLTALLE
ncbi:MAG: lipoyl(octanoyl) transferase LipB [Desulfobacterales bacterium]|nr:lipoyl(octanoyl) transferase LipB [Desulfobacterales bacterium]